MLKLGKRKGLGKQVEGERLRPARHLDSHQRKRPARQHIRTSTAGLLHIVVRKEKQHIFQEHMSEEFSRQGGLDYSVAATNAKSGPWAWWSHSSLLTYGQGRPVRQFCKLTQEWQNLE